MTLDVGPVAPSSARVWFEWTHKVLQELRNEPVSTTPLPVQVLDDVDAYLDDWGRVAPTTGGAFRWQAEVDADELEYLTNAFYNLDLRLSAEVRRGERQPGPAAGLTFHLVLVGALLHALALEGGPRAQFVEQLRSSWPAAAQVGSGGLGREDLEDHR